MKKMANGGMELEKNDMSQFTYLSGSRTIKSRIYSRKKDSNK